MPAEYKPERASEGTIDRGSEERFEMSEAVPSLARRARIRLPAVFMACLVAEGL